VARKLGLLGRSRGVLSNAAATKPEPASKQSLPKGAYDRIVPLIIAHPK